MVVRSVAAISTTLMLLAAALAGCGRSGSAATLEAPIQLAPGQSATFDAEDIEVTFVDIAEDSRCPSDATCVWSGQVVVQFAVDVDGREQQIAIKETQSHRLDGGYQLSVLQVLPPRISSQRIAPADYRVTLKVTRLGTQ